MLALFKRLGWCSAITITTAVGALAIVIYHIVVQILPHRIASKNLVLETNVASEIMLPHNGSLGDREGAYDESSQQKRIDRKRTWSIFQSEQETKNSDLG